MRGCARSSLLDPDLGIPWPVPIDFDFEELHAKRCKLALRISNKPLTWRQRLFTNKVYDPCACGDSKCVSHLEVLKELPHAGKVGCLCNVKGGSKHVCDALNEKAIQLDCSSVRVCICAHYDKSICKENDCNFAHTAKVGAFTLDDFAGSPQQHALLNRHLSDYLKDRQRSQQTTPYAIPASQMHLLPDLGMEPPQPDAPVVPHPLHKSIEEATLRRMNQFLPENAYNLICVKDAKVSKLPQAHSLQNPIRQAKDASRFSETDLVDADISTQAVHFMHDVASEVTPHALVEKLSKQNPNSHLFVTGVTPAEVLTRATSFEPASHTIEYSGGRYNFIFAGSASESYSTSIATTKAWLMSNQIVASNGEVYNVVLLDYKLGHVLFHIFRAGSEEPQHTRTFPTGSMVYLPPAVTGTFKGEYLPAKLITSCLDFVRRTPDLSTRNLAAKVSQVANAVNPRTTSRERYIMWHVMAQLAPYKTVTNWAWKIGWTVFYAMSLQWQMLAPAPDLYSYIDERKRHLTVEPTRGGGWQPQNDWTYARESIPNSPTMLQRFSAFTATAFVYLLPKLVLGELFTLAFLHIHLWEAIRTVWHWLDIRPLRALLTAFIVISLAIVPGRVLSYFGDLSSHYSRQLWWPCWLFAIVEMAIVEFTGAPGARLTICPGRGWFWQALIWAIAIHSVLPGLVPALVVPWVAFTHGWTALMAPWLALIVAENVFASSWYQAFQPDWPRLVQRHHRTTTKLLDIATSFHLPRRENGRWEWRHSRGLRSLPKFMASDASDAVAFILKAMSFLAYLALKHANRFQRVLGSCGPPPPRPTATRRVPPVIRRRNVDRVLPTLVVQNQQVLPPVGAQLAIPPDGLNFPDWLDQVTQAYNRNPRLHPQLTPGQDCFWQAVATLGGTPHMWYCWFMQFMRRTAQQNQAVIGNVSIVDMHLFASVSGIGVKLSGLTEEISAPRDGRPTLYLVVTQQPFGRSLHVEPVAAPTLDPSVAALARLLSTLHFYYPAWYAQVLASHANAPADSMPAPTGTLRTMMGAHPIPSTMSQVTDAVANCLALTRIVVAAPDGYNIVLANSPLAGQELFDYPARIQTAMVARTPPNKMWSSFRKLKVGATPRQQRNNASHNNTRPEPPMWTVLSNELRTKLADYDIGQLPIAKLQEERLTYTADVPRAARLVADLKAHPQVLGGKADARWLQSLDSIVDMYRLEGRTVTVPVRAYFGVGGCGKTTATIEYLKTLSVDERRNVRVVSHTESLRAQAKQNIDFEEMRGVNFPTLPGLLAEPSTGTVVFDDAGKFYGGVLDLVLLTNPLIPEVVVNGDPAQGLAKFPVGGTQSEFDVGPLVVAQHTTKYATVSHRWFGLLAETLGVHTTNLARGHLTHTVASKPGLPVTTASPRYVQVLSSSGRRAYTHDSIQGEDFDEEVEFDMTALEETVSDRSAYVALGRSSKGVYLHMGAAAPGSVIRAPPTGSDLLNAIIYSMRSDNSSTLYRGNNLTRAAFYAHLHACMPNLVWFAAVGASIDPAKYQTVAPLTRDTIADEGGPTETQPRESAKVSAAPCDTIVHETHFVAKEFRELNRAGLQTDQFKENAFVNPHVHKRHDHATYKLTVEKRINNATPAANYTRKRKCKREDMMAAFDRLVPVMPAWTPEKHEYYTDLARREYESGRTDAAVMAKINAHDPERAGTDVVNSLKAQVIKKSEKRDKNEAIPGQLIYEYDIKQTLEDAPYALFLENEVFAAFPKRYLFYRRMNPAQFIEAYKSSWRVGNGVYTSDVTRWDVGCDAGVLNFDEHVFRRAGFPEKYVAAYVHRRLSTKTQHGMLRTSQPSGDRFTWTLNSLRRAVVHELTHDVNEADTVAVNGDDCAMDRHSTSKHFPDSVWEFKDLNGDRGEFSGFELGGETPEYSASGIHYRAMILVSRDPSALDKWTNYLDLLQYADLDSWEALDVARLAQLHMPPDRFNAAVPQALLPLLN